MVLPVAIHKRRVLKMVGAAAISASAVGASYSLQDETADAELVLPTYAADDAPLEDITPYEEPLAEPHEELNMLQGRMVMGDIDYAIDDIEE